MKHYVPSPEFNAVIFQAAGSHLGTREIEGPLHNPEIVSWFADSGHPGIKDDETPYCAAFVGSILAEVGLIGTGKLNARSYNDWGVEVSLANVRTGDIVVFWRGSPNGWKGHVGFVVRIDGDKVVCRGANQRNTVSDEPYPLEQVLSFRRAVREAPSKKPTLKLGDSGPFVTYLQHRLVELNFFLGKLDGKLEGHTESAVMQFQSVNGLKTDGVVGPKTWKRLESPQAHPAKAREVDLSDLQEDPTVKGSKKIQNLSIGGVTIDAALKVAEAAQKSEGIVETLSNLPWTHLLIVGGLGLAAYIYASRIKKERLHAAQTGGDLRL